MNHIKATMPADLDHRQFAYKFNECTKDATSLLQYTNTYMRMLFVDFSTAFSTVCTGKLVNKLLSLSLDYHLRNWIKDFLSNRPQHMRLGDIISLTPFSALAPLRVFSVQTLFTHDT